MTSFRYVHYVACVALAGNPALETQSCYSSIITKCLPSIVRDASKLPDITPSDTVMVFSIRTSVIPMRVSFQLLRFYQSAVDILVLEI